MEPLNPLFHSRFWADAAFVRNMPMLALPDAPHESGGRTPSLHHSLLRIVQAVSASCAFTMLSQDVVAQQPPAPSNKLVQSPRDVASISPEIEKRMTDALEALRGPNVAVLIDELDHPSYHKRAAASRELEKRIGALCALQNPPPSTFDISLRGALSTTSSAEQRSRLESLTSVAARMRNREGSRIPPYKGGMSSVLEKMHALTGTEVVLPSGFSSSQFFEIREERNSLWEVIALLESQGLYVQSAEGHRLMLTQERDKGKRIFARQGSMVLLAPANRAKHEQFFFSVLGEPGQMDMVAMVDVHASKEVAGRVGVLPSTRNAQRQMCSSGGEFEHKAFSVADNVPRPKEGDAHLSISVLVATQRKRITMPIEDKKTHTAPLGSRHNVQLQCEGEGITLTLIPFHDVAWPPTPVELDHCLYRMGELSQVRFFDDTGTPVPAELPSPSRSYRSMVYTMKKPPRAAKVEVFGCGESSVFGEKFTVPSQDLELAPAPPAPPPTSKPDVPTI